MAENRIQEIDEKIQIGLARHDFWEFCLHMDAPFFESRKFLVQVASALMWVYTWYCNGVAKRVSISMPPRAGKSYIASLFAAWWLGKFPDKAVMRNSCTARLYEKFSRDVRNIVISKKYRQVFPQVELDPTCQSVEGWKLKTSTQMGYFGAGVGGTIIGFGANLAMSDDLYKSFADAMSENNNEFVHEWKDGAHDSRFEGCCPEIFIGTRWLKKDVIGKAISKGRIHKSVKVPALIDGQSFCEEVRTTEQYLETKATVDKIIWDAEYMQDPGDMVGCMFPSERLTLYNPATARIETEHTAVYVDPADEGGDNLASPVGQLVGDKIYIPHVICNNFGVDVTEQTVSDQIVDNRADAVRIEGNSGWILFEKAIKRKVKEQLPDCDIQGLKNMSHKMTRIAAQSEFILNRFIFRSDWESIPDYRRFIETLTGYMRDGGSNQEDGAPDALAGLAVYFRKKFPNIFPH